MDTVAGVHFLPPIGRHGEPTKGSFDPHVELTIKAFNLADGELVASFSVVDGSIEVVSDPGSEEKYHADWQLSRAALEDGATVRIEVRLPHAEVQETTNTPVCPDGVHLLRGCVAFVDIQVSTRGGKASDGLMIVNRSQTLPIKIHIAEGAVQVNLPGQNEHNYPPDSTEYFYIMSREAAAEAFASGYAEVAPERRFTEVSLVITAEGNVDNAAFQVLHENGHWSDWAPLQVEWSFLIFHKAFLELREPALELRIRDVGQVEFIRFQFLHDRGAASATLQSAAVEALASRPGPWALPPDVEIAGDKQYVPYDGPETECSSGLTPGAEELIRYVMGAFEGIAGVEGYSCRPNTADPNTWSMHSFGRAVDIMIRPDGVAADNDIGDPIANWFVSNAQATGAQYLIWDRSQWLGAAIPPKLRLYTGPHPHHDHIHVEITTEAAQKRTPWFLDREGQERSDLVVRGLVVNPPSGMAGSAVEIAFTIENIGEGMAYASRANIRINTDQDAVTPLDSPLELGIPVPKLGPGEDHSVSRWVDMPETLPAGTYYIWVIADVHSTAWQSDETNDFASVAFSVGDASATFATAAQGRSDGFSVSTLADGSSIVTGYIEGSTTFGATTLENAGDLNNPDIFVAKLSASGSWEWATRAGGAGKNVGAAVSALEDGSAIVTGFFSRTATFGGVTLMSSRDQQMYVAKIDPTGVWAWAVAVGGTNGLYVGTTDWYGLSVSALPDGGAIVLGPLKTTATLGDAVLTEVGVLVARIDADANWVWAKAVANGNSVSALADGAAIIAGTFRGSISFGDRTLTSDVDRAAYVAKIGADGVWQWSNASSSACAAYTAGPVSYSVSAFADGSAMLAGSIRSGGGKGVCTVSFGDASVTVNQDVDDGPSAVSDAFVAKIDASGEWVWATSAPSESQDKGDWAGSISVLADGGGIVTGHLDDWTSFGFTSVLHNGPFVAKVTAQGAWEWLATADSNNPYWTTSRSVSALADGSAVVAGGFSGTLSFGDRAITSDRFTVFVAKIGADGSW